MAEFPALPIWTDAYMLDCGHLSDAEHGRYFLLLMLIWRSPRCRIPNDPDWIARKLNRSVSRFQAEIEPIIKEFCFSSGNWLEQKRLTKEYKYLQGQSKKQSDNAKSRWNKEKEPSQTHAKRMPNRSQTHAPTPTPTPLKEINKEKLGGKEKNGQVFVIEGSRGWAAWKAYRNGRLNATERKGADGPRSRGWYFPSEFPPAKKEK